MPRLPPLAVLLAVLALVPLLCCAAGAALLPGDQGAGYLAALLSYGAVSLSFFGAVHWGLALAGGRGTARRLLLGGMPALAGWVALLSAIPLGPGVALGVLLAGFLATVLAETRAWRRGALGRGYLVLRWVWSGIALAALAVVTLVHAAGLHLRF